MFADLFEDRPKQVRPNKQIDDPREFLTAVMNEDPEVMNSDYLQMRMRAAIELLPYSHPKLAVTAMVTEQSFAELLERRLRHMAQVEAKGNSQQQIEQQPQIETSKPLPRTNDRRLRRM
jgi:hypothetical protein